MIPVSFWGLRSGLAVQTVGSGAARLLQVWFRRELSARPDRRLGKRTAASRVAAA